jgi:sulfide:quinone oxidoreductase
MTSSTPPLRVLVAGGGVAAVEALLALRDLARERVDVAVLAPSPEFVHRPSSVLAPFGGTAPPRTPLERLAQLGVRIHRGALAGVDAERREVRTTAGQVLAYDRLLVAVGALAQEALPGAITFAGPSGGGAVEGALRQVERAPDGGLLFVAPDAATWSLPVYELALMGAHTLARRGVRDAELAVVTPEARPLELFGRVASDAVARLLDRAGVGFDGDTAAAIVLDGALMTRDGRLLRADQVIALPLLHGPRIPGLPHDDDGFLPVDAHGHVAGCDGVYAAGDAAAYPVKQGGLAAQQADAVAEAIAAEAGAELEPAPFQPVLRGLLLTGEAPLYMRAELGGEAVVRTLDGAPALASRAPLWWPTGKVAGRYLTRFLESGEASGGLTDWAPQTTPAEERAATIELMELLADEDAALGDYRQALHALDAAEALAGGDPRGAYAETRARWERARGELASAPR